MVSNRPRNGPNEETEATTDVDEWEAAIRDVRPLADRDEPPEGRSMDLPEMGLADRLKVKQEQASAPGEGQPFALDRRTAERLKRGLIGIESQLDLHGLTQEEALAALDAFLWQAWGAEQRCVLVITGKGTAREGGGRVADAHPHLARRRQPSRSGARGRDRTAATRRRRRALRPAASPARLASTNRARSLPERVETRARATSGCRQPNATVAYQGGVDPRAVSAAVESAGVAGRTTSRSEASPGTPIRSGKP
jgi:DNA-nicking Smr family endonuclease